MNPFLRYLADKKSAHRQTDRQTDRHTPMTTRPCGLRRAGNYYDRAFPVAASRAWMPWNSLPPAIRTVSSFTSFRQQPVVSIPLGAVAQFPPPTHPNYPCLPSSPFLPSCLLPFPFPLLFFSLPLPFPLSRSIPC